jgi:hypothetical protein
MKLKQIITIICIIYVSCAPVIQFNSFDKEARKPNIGTIDIYTTAESVPYIYKEIGLITVDDQGWEKSESELLNLAIEKAKQIGAEGLLLLQQDKQIDGYYKGIAINRRIFRASAIIKISEKQTGTKNIVDLPSSQYIADELLKLKKLKDEGVLTEDEFEKQKAKLLNN